MAGGSWAVVAEKGAALRQPDARREINSCLRNALEAHLELFRLWCCLERNALMDVFLLDEFHQRAGEVEHAFVVALLDDVEKFTFTTFEDVLLHTWRIDENLKRRNTTDVRVQRRKKFLIDDRAQVVSE